MQHPNIFAGKGFCDRLLALLLLVGLIVPSTVFAKNKSAFSQDCAAERARVKARLTEVLKQQRSDGSRQLAPADAVLIDHPLAATIALEIALHDGDAVLLTAAQKACVDHANHLLAGYDRDNDYLLEGSSWANGSEPGTVERVGYNALLAIDLMSLSRLCAATEQPVDALFWYQSMRTVVRRLLDETYDPDRGLFMPVTAGDARGLTSYNALSTMPVYFDTMVGDDIIRAVLSNYVLNDPKAAADGAARYLDPARAAEYLSTGVDAPWALRSVLLLGALSRNGFESAAREYAAGLSTILSNCVDKDSFRGERDSEVYTKYFACLIANGGYTTFVPRWHELELLRAVGHMYGVLDLDGRRKLDHDTDIVVEFLADPSGRRDEAALAATAMRGIYVSISTMNAAAKQRKLFNPRDRQQIPGFDIYTAFAELTADVIQTLHSVENQVSNISSGGLTAEAMVERTVITRDQAVPVKVVVGSNNGTLEVSSVRLLYDQQRTTLMQSDTPLRLTPGTTKGYWFQYSPPEVFEGAVHPVRFQLEIRLADRRAFRYHFDRSVFVRKPLTLHATLPEGNIVAGEAVPLDIRVDKHVPEQYVVTAQWFSAAGLDLIEGSTLETTIPAESKSTATTLHIQAPKNCRPGAFTYTMKIFGNGAEKGTISGTLFKHYQWLFVGPFGRKNNAIDAEYPPERGVNLRASYEGAIRPISWIALPGSAYRGDGELDLGSLVPQVSTSYLYTVVKASVEKETTISFGSTAPAAVFINGAEVFKIDKPMDGGRHRVPVFLGPGRNSILIKMLSADRKRVFFQLGDEENLTPDEFNNNLWELVDGYQDFYARSQGEFTTAQQVVTLTYRDPKAQSVAVIGSFNGWAPDNAGMRLNKKGEWELSLHLLPGRYTYRFLIDNATQVVDPKSSAQEPDGYGGMQSVLVVRQVP